MSQIVVPKLSKADLAKSFEQRLHSEVREVAQVHTRTAIETLVHLMKDEATPPGVRRQSAIDVLSQGWGRPDSRTDSGGDKGTARGLTVNILKLSSGMTERIDATSEDAKAIIEAVDVAAAVEEATKEIMP